MMVINCEVEVISSLDDDNDGAGISLLRVMAADSENKIRIMLGAFDLIVNKSELERALKACSC